MAMVWSAVWQSHGSPLAEQTLWPNWVIFMAVQDLSGMAESMAEIREQTTLVLPMLRVCPPMTMTAME
jgi:hypothetical protein